MIRPPPNMKVLFVPLFCFFSLFTVCLKAETDLSGEALYNGIRLPSGWPPQEGDPAAFTAMDVPYLRQVPSIIPIDVGRQLFVDSFLIEKSDLKRVFHPAKKYEGNPVLKPETPLELEPPEKQGSEGAPEAVMMLGQGAFFYDPSEKLFKIWYTAGWRKALAMAVSKDGLQWQRVPDAITSPSKEAGLGDYSLWFDIEAPSAERYKFIMNRAKGHQLWTSPDAKNWSAAVLAGKAKDYCSIFYNPFRKVWVYSIKESLPTPRGRMRRYAESPVFLKPNIFDTSVYWTGADTLDTPDPTVRDPAQLYNLNAVAYESIMLGMFCIHLGPHNKVCKESKSPKAVDLKLAYSRDGFHWDRPDRQPFLAGTRKKGDWDKAYLHCATGILSVVGDTLLIPYCATSGLSPKGDEGMYNGMAIGIATLRRDGFVSLDAGVDGGTVTTRPVKFSGRYLFVNVNCPQGEFRAEVLDENSKPIAPFTLENCTPVKGDSTLQRIIWKDGSDLSSLAEKPVKFRFHLKEGSLYAFWVSPDESGASHGYVGAGGPGFAGQKDLVGAAAYQAAAGPGFTSNRDAVGKKALEDGK